MSIRRRNSPQKVAVAVGVTVLASAALAALFSYQTWTTRQALREDYCRQEGPVGILAVAIDATDLLSEPQRLDVMNRVETLVDEADVNWRVELWNVAPSSGVPTIYGNARCIPPKDASPMTGNPAKTRARFGEFKTGVHRELSVMLSQTGSSSSPILESIQAVGLRSFGAPELEGARAHRLLLVSDLVQNTGRVSFLGGLPPYDEFRRSKVFDALRAPLSGASVDVLLLSRSSGVSSSALVGWWQNYFADVGASVASVQRIVG